MKIAASGVFGPFCGLITSYEPNHNAISKELKDSDERYKFDTYTKHVLAKDQTTSQYETEMKRRVIKEPANLKLLIVVSKLLTGFDAPSCTYIYLDNELRDHKAKDLLEYVVVHEMLHLLEPTHSDQFVALLTRHWPQWQESRAELNALPLAAGL